MSPFIPNSAMKISSMLSSKIDIMEPEVGVNKWQLIKSDKFELVGSVDLLFSKLDKEVVLNEKI
jgi:hypothetical protein